MGLEVNPRTKHNKFAGLAVRVGTWVVRLLKVLLQRLIILEVFVPNLVSLAYKAFFVRVPHVCVKFIVTKKAFAAELAKRMYAALDLILGRTLLRPALHRGEMGEELRGRV
jgi:hypothetical protein